MGQNSAKYYGAHYGAHSDAESELHEDGDFTENDEVIARSLQEELSQVAAAQASGSSHTTEEELQDSVSAQNWLASFTTRKYTSDDFSTLDGEVCKRLNQMNPVPHVPKINGDLPSVDEEISDHQRLLDSFERCLINYIELPNTTCLLENKFFISLNHILRTMKDMCPCYMINISGRWQKVENGATM